MTCSNCFPSEENPGASTVQETVPLTPQASPRAMADSELAFTYANALAQNEGFSLGEHVLLGIPAESTLAQWWRQLDKQLKIPPFKPWADKEGVEGDPVAPLTLTLSTGDLTTSINGENKTFTLADDSSWSEVAAPILTLAKMVGPSTSELRHSPWSSSNPLLPLEQVAGFYGEHLFAEPARNRQRGRVLSASKSFDVGVLSERQQTLGNLQNIDNLIGALRNLAELQTDKNLSDGMKQMTLQTHPDSTFSRQQSVSVEAFIKNNGWNLPTTPDEINNLIKVLLNPLPVQPPNRDYWGLLSRPVPLTQAHRNIVNTMVENWITPDPWYLVTYYYGLADSPDNASVRLRLDALIASRPAQEMGEWIELELQGVSTGTSPSEWLMTALVLNLDPLAGKQRNTVAGYRLDQTHNWGERPTTIIESVRHHLDEEKQLSPEVSELVSYLFLSHIAPEFLVKGLPEELLYGSHAWASYSAAVAQVERLAPGTALAMTYQQIMRFGSLDPISPMEKQIESETFANSIIDWGVINGFILKKTDNTYSFEDLNRAQKLYNRQSSALRYAGVQLASPLPMRSKIAEDDLKGVYGEHFDIDARILQSTSGRYGLAYYLSLHDVHMAGELQRGQWRSIDKISTAEMEAKIPQLRDMNILFKFKFDQYYADITNGVKAVLKNMFSLLAPEDRESLEYGEQIFYYLRTPGSPSFRHPLAKLREENKGRRGLLIRSEFETIVSYFEVFPDCSTIQKRTDLPASLTIGAFFAGQPRVEIPTRKPFDWDAYKNGTAPRSPKPSFLVIEEIVPSKPWIATQDESFPMSFFSKKSDYIATVAAEQHFIYNYESLKALAFGSTGVDELRNRQQAGKEAILGLIPFATTIKNAIEGKAAEAITSFLIDATLLFVPIKLNLGGIARSAASRIKSLNILRKMLVKATRSTDDLVGLLANSEKAAKSFYSTIPSFSRNGIANRTLPIAPVFKQSNVAEGIFLPANRIEAPVNVPAQFDGVDKWFPVDSNNRAYGTALPNFRSNNSITLTRRTFGDGTSALIPDQLFTQETLVLNRRAHSDLLVADKVYRYDPVKPDAITELSSADHFKVANNFEALCSAGSRVKRELNDLCFSKVILKGIQNTEKTVQALEHQRLFPAAPSAGKARTVVHERRLYKVEYGASTELLVPEHFSGPIEYKSSITGHNVRDEYFGFPELEFEKGLNDNTRVIKLDAISAISDDKRQLRGFLIDHPMGSSPSEMYLVVEADTGVFYYQKFDDNAVKLTFNRAEYDTSDLLGRSLIMKHDAFKKSYLINSGLSANRDFVSLPPIDLVYAGLKKKGATDLEVSNIKKAVATLSSEKKRELVFELWNNGDLRNIHVALEPVKVPDLMPPPDLHTHPVEQRNRFYAREAKKAVDVQFQITGVRSRNLRLHHNPASIDRADAAHPVVMWIYDKWDTPDYGDLILKTGAGNCDQMALAAAEIITKNGGTARLMSMPGAHAFTLVGDAPINLRTYFFAEPEWSQTRIVDPWANIECPSSEYVQQFQRRMYEWKAEGRQIQTNAGHWIEADDPDWVDKTVNAIKQ